MNQEGKSYGVGRIVAGCLLGALLAVAAPFMLLTQLMSLLPVVFLPALGLVLIDRWAGRGPGCFAAAAQLMIGYVMLGGAYALISLFTAVLPVYLLLRAEKKPFFEQLRLALIGFGAGVLASVLVLFAQYGGNMIERVMRLLPQGVRALPADSLTAMLATLPALGAVPTTLEAFYAVVDQMVEALVPIYQQNLPGLIFGGALLTAVLCTALGMKLLARRGLAVEGAYVPLRAWALPPSTTGGLLLLSAAGYLLNALGVRGGITVFQTVFQIAVYAFCVQAFASASRRLRASVGRRGLRALVLAALVLLALLGYAPYLAIYGCLSAIFGSRGALHGGWRAGRTPDGGEKTQPSADGENRPEPSEEGAPEGGGEPKPSTDDTRDK